MGLISTLALQLVLLRADLAELGKVAPEISSSEADITKKDPTLSPQPSCFRVDVHKTLACWAGRGLP